MMITTNTTTVRCDTLERDGLRCVSREDVEASKRYAKRYFSQAGWTFKHGKAICPKCNAKKGLI